MKVKPRRTRAVHSMYIARKRKLKVILSDFISVSQVFLTTLVACGVAEPPALSQSYGLPEITSGYSYHPSSSSHSSASSHGSALSHGTDYYETHVGHQTSEGLHLDQNLLHKIEGVLVNHENANRGGYFESAPSSGYGVPQAAYGPPSHQHWSGPSKVVGIDFDHLRQSHQVAQYHGKDRYASGWSTGNTGNSGWRQSNAHSGWQSANSGWQAANSGWQSANLGWQLAAPAPSKISGWRQSGWTQPATIITSSPGWQLTAPKPSAGWTLARPSIKYGSPASW